MKDFLKIITRDDIYNIIVPIGLVVVGWIFQFVSGCFKKEKHWKYVKEKSSRDNYFNYFISIIGFGVLVFGTYLLIILCIELTLDIKFDSTVIKISYSLFNILLYIWLFAGIHPQKGKVVFKYQFKHEKDLIRIIYKIPVVLSCIMWSCIFSANAKTILKIVTILIFIFEITFLVILDGDENFKYRCAKFCFYGEKEIDNIMVESIYQKRNWILAKQESGVEYRFRIKDIERVEYR